MIEFMCFVFKTYLLVVFVVAAGADLFLFFCFVLFGAFFFFFLHTHT